MSMPPAHRPPNLDDRELARRAAAGDGHAFAQLYDRHEQRVYGFCLRLLGSPHDAADATQETFVRMLARLPSLQNRELNFVAYALTAARNACYDMIEGRRRSEPVSPQPDESSGGSQGGAGHALDRATALDGDGLLARGGGDRGDVALDPERSALLSAAREDVRAANAALPARQREVLALREVELLSYDEIGEIMGLNRNAVAQLVSRARIKLRDLLRGSALASISTSSQECTRALPLLAALQDGEQGEQGEQGKQGKQGEQGEEGEEGAELDWLRAHLADCDTCRLGRAAMEEAGTSYRLLAPVVPLVWLRHASIARAAEFVGADWSDIAGVRPTGEGDDAEVSGSDGAAASVRHSGSGSRSRRRRTIAAGVLALGLLLGAIFGLTRGDSGKRLAANTDTSAANTAAVATAATTTTVSTSTPVPAQSKQAPAAVHTQTRILRTSTTTSHSAIAPTVQPSVSPHASPHARTHHHRAPKHKPPKPKPPVAPPPRTTPAPPPIQTTTTTATTSAPPLSTTTTQTTSTSASTTTTSSSETTSRETIPGGGLIP
jgi:RNA polymerase sigma-70 factor (ECF subfamily)